MEKKSLGQKIINAPYILWAALFIVVPLIVVAWYSFTGEDGSLTIKNFTAILDAKYQKVFLNSLAFAFVATVICLVLAYPIAYFISRATAKVQKLMVVFIMLPMWTNILIRTYSWLALLEDAGIVNTVLANFGIEPVKFIGTPGAVILGMVYNFLPFMILPIYSVMSKMDRRVIEAAQDLGCDGFQVLTKVIIPLSVPGIVSGITMVFVPAISTFYISQKLGGGKITLVGDTIEQQFKYIDNGYHVGAAFSLLLMLLILACTAIMNKFTDGEDGILM